MLACGFPCSALQQHGNYTEIPAEPLRASLGASVDSLAVNLHHDHHLHLLAGSDQPTALRSLESQGSRRTGKTNHKATDIIAANQSAASMSAAMSAGDGSHPMAHSNVTRCKCHMQSMTNADESASSVMVDIEQLNVLVISISVLPIPPYSCLLQTGM